MLIIDKKKQATVFLVLLACSIFVNFSKITTHKLEYDEVYVLARSSAQSLNTQVQSFDIDLRKPQPVEKIYEKMNVPPDQSLWSNYKKHFQNFHQISNHPPVNDFLAKLFVYRDSDFVHMRYYAFTSFIFLLLCFSFFLSSNGFKLHEILAITSLYSSISLVSYQSIFPKSYSLFIGFFLLAICFLQKYLKKRSLANAVILLILINLCFFTHFITVIFLPITVLLVLICGQVKQEKFLSIFWKYKIELGLLAVNVLAMKPLMDYQTEGTFSHFEELSFSNLINKFVYNSFVLMTMNFNMSVAIILFFVFVVMLIKQKNLILSNLHLKIFLCLILTIFFLDWCLSSRLSANIRFFLVAMPFWTIVIYQLFSPFKEKIFIISLIALTLFSNINYRYQMKKSINLMTNKTIHEASKKSLDLDKKTLIVIQNFNPMEISYLHHLITRSLKKHPLSMVKANEYPKIKSLYFVTEDVFEDMQDKGSDILKTFTKVID